MQERLSTDIVDVIDTQGVNSKPGIIDKIKIVNEKIAPVTTLISLYLIIEGWSRKDWNQITIGLGLAAIGYYGLGDSKSEFPIETEEATIIENDIYNNLAP